MAAGRSEMAPPSVVLIPSKNGFHLMAYPREGDAFKTVITHASLLVRKVKLNPAVALAHAKALEKGTMKYPLKRVLLKTFSIPTGNLGAVQDNLFLSQLPTRVVIGLVSSGAFNGHLTKNPFDFKHQNLSLLSLYVEGKQIPSKPLTPNYDKGLYVRSYFNLFAGTGAAHRDADNYIAYDDFSRGYTLYVFDLTPSLLDGVDQVELIKSGSLRLELKFDKPLTEPLHAVVYAELDSLLEIDRSRQILTDFAA